MSVGGLHYIHCVAHLSCLWSSQGKDLILFSWPSESLISTMSQTTKKKKKNFERRSQASHMDVLQETPYGVKLWAVSAERAAKSFVSKQKIQSN